MSTIEAELNDFKKQREQLEKDIATANNSLQQTQAQLTEANNKRSSLLTKIAAREKTAKEIGTTKDAGKAQREKIAKELADAQTAFDDLQTRLDAEIPA